MITIGSVSLDDSYSPMASSTYEYYKSTGGEIIGGFQLIKITGSVVVGGIGQTGATVMSKIKGIVDLGKLTKCISVSIPNFYSGLAKINNVTADQGSDPAWINKADFSIEIKAPLQTIPSNSFNIVALDSVTEISRSSKIELPEDSHGYIYYGGRYSKVFAISNTTLTVRCDPICGSNSFASVINKLIKEELHTIFSEYSGWNKYARNLSVQIGPDNSATISKDYLITPHQATAFIDLNFGFEKSYADKSKKKSVGGTITGLTDASVFTRTTISGTCGASKLDNAESVLSDISSKYYSITSWEGITLDLVELPNCPKKDPNNKCSWNDDEEDEEICLKPRSSTVSRSRTEGTITFSFEWTSDSIGDCDNQNGVTTDIVVDVKEAEPQFAEFVIPTRGTLIQDLKTKNAKTVNITISKNFPTNSCSTDDPCQNNDDTITKTITDILNEHGGVNTFILILDTLTKSTTSTIIEKGYIQCIQQ